ncbi:MAG TPA: hypothetical protein VGP92_00680 [Acidimicrobiia bacterium]|nr:hypothetical protein [Acidimicrobiia bacterium]
MSARSLLVVALAVAGTGAACGSNSGASSTDRLPRNDAAVADASIPLLVPFKVQVQRASVGNRPGARGGRELSLYVRPARTESATRYASRFAPLAIAVVPALFAKYPGIDWIDVCQEPAKSSGAWETVPVTRIEISRRGGDLVEWARADLATLLATHQAHPLELTIDWQNGVGRTKVWTDATARARTLGG